MSVTNHTITLPGQTLSVRMGFNALRRMQEALGNLPIQQIAERLLSGQAGPLEWSVMLWAGLETARLQQDRPGRPWTQDRVGDLIDEIGMDAFADTVVPALSEALRQSWPKPAPAGQGAAPAGPRKAAEGEPGTGTSSSTPPRGRASEKKTSG